jgi:uncharacterized membrane protein YeaQ/YmgE (transglycosylase-associated protein family)
MFNGILGYIIGGAVIGILARLFKPGADPVGWIMTIVIGIVGAVIGSYLYGGHGWITWVVAIIAAIVLLVVWEAVRRKTPRA